jgi:hypothetical protein
VALEASDFAFVHFLFEKPLKELPCRPAFVVGLIVPPSALSCVPIQTLNEQIRCCDKQIESLTAGLVRWPRLLDENRLLRRSRGACGNSG